MAPVARPLAVKIVHGRVIDALGWWTLRQHHTRRELVESGLIARSGSYRQEEHFEQLFGKTVEEMTRAEITAWVKSIGAD